MVQLTYIYYLRGTLMTRARDVANLIGSGNYSSTTFTATAGQTAFTITHTQGFIQVFMNGLLLDETVDYTSNGSAVTLTSGAAAGDEIEVVAYNTFSVGDAITQTAADARYYTQTDADTRYVNATGDTMSGDLTVTGNVDVSGNAVAGEFYNGSRKQYDQVNNSAISNTGNYDNFPRNSIQVVQGTITNQPYSNTGIALDYSSYGLGTNAFTDDDLDQRGVQIYHGDTYGQTFIRRRQGQVGGVPEWHEWERVITSKAPSQSGVYGGVVQVRGTSTNAITQTTSQAGFEAMKTSLTPHHAGNHILVMGTVYGSANDDAHAWLEYRINSGSWVRNSDLNGTYNSGAAFADFSITRSFSEPDQQVGFSTHAIFNPNTTNLVEVRVICSAENSNGFNLNIGTSRDTAGSYNNTTTKSTLVLMELAY